MNILSEYIKYRWKAKGRHGTHSPFIYEMVDSCFDIQPEASFMKDRDRLFSELRRNSTIIEVTDLGAGSKKLLKQRKIKDIFRTGSSVGKYGDLLFKICRFYQPKNVLELGTSLGIGTIHMHYGWPDAAITTIEGCSETQKIALSNFEKMHCKNITSNNSSFQDFLEQRQNHVFDLVFIDGHHEGKALLHYLKLLEKFTHDETILILDDIRWSDSMFNAWSEIKRTPHYHVTIDLFRIGVVLRRSVQEKEHFTVKI